MAHVMHGVTSRRCSHFSSNACGEVWWWNTTFYDSVGSMMTSSSWWYNVCERQCDYWPFILFFLLLFILSLFSLPKYKDVVSFIIFNLVIFLLINLFFSISSLSFGFYIKIRPLFFVFFLILLLIESCFQFYTLVFNFNLLYVEFGPHSFYWFFLSLLLYLFSNFIP